MKSQDTYDYVVVGAGLFGATVAERLAAAGKKVLIIDRRDHLAGNSYSYTDPNTGIEVHKYGSHIFHTENDKVWRYITRFTDFSDYIHTVPTRHAGKLYPMPINLDTINLLYGRKMNAKTAEAFVKKEATKAGIKNPSNFDEKGRSLVGDKLYETFLKHYTEKQWNTSAENISADILSRIPVRFSHDDRYFITAKHQGIPVAGYTKIVENMLKSKNITVRLSTDFRAIADQIPDTMPVIYCGQIDELLNYEFGVLPYRSLRFELKTIDEAGKSALAADSRLAHAVINEADSDIPYTRTHFFKYYQIHQPAVIANPSSIVCHEYPANFKRGGEAYYPVNNPESEELYNRYVARLKELHPNYYLGGRLGAYRYWDMDVAIAHALELVDELNHAAKITPPIPAPIRLSTPAPELVSMVVPVYNTAPYLRDCLKSIAAQTYSNLQVILVDDASTDKSGAICDDFVSRDQRFQVVHLRKNQGLATARNRGIALVHGAYISFVDSDDQIEPDFINKLFAAIKKSDADISVCGYTTHIEKPLMDLRKNLKHNYYASRLRGIASGATAAEHLLTHQENPDLLAWNKLYRADIFKNIHFESARAHEDVFTTYKLLAAAKKVAFLGDPLYRYTLRADSIMGQAKPATLLAAKLRAARSAKKYFSDQIRQGKITKSSSLVAAAAFSEILAEFAYLDAAVRKDLPAAEFAKHRLAALELVKSAKSSKNPHLTRRVKIYATLLRPLNGAPYKLFRTFRLLLPASR